MEPPSIEELGRDLLETTRRQRWLVLARPFAYLAVYAAAAARGWWWLALPAVFFVFVAVIEVTHDAVHGTLGLRRRGSNLALFLVGALLLVSGHAYRQTHQQHHRAFPDGDDPEGAAARMTPLRALLDGPVHVWRLWWWAFRRARRRGWLLAEGALPPAALAAGIVLAPRTPWLLLYVVFVIAGGWLYPLLTVHLPHRHFGDEPLTQSHTARGRILPPLLLEQTYHLEHHLYPRVPSHKLPELARRLEPWLREAGVEPVRVP